MDFCAAIDFGSRQLSKDEERLRQGLNRQILEVIRSLPHAVQTRTFLALVHHLKLPLAPEVDFFTGFYPPTWTILHWISSTFNGKGALSEKDLRPYQAVHAIAMLLHLIDDHITDGDLPATHLALLFRSQSWMVMHRAIENLTADRKNDRHRAQGFIARYYSAVESSGEMDSLDAYCAQFKDAIGMGYIAPALLTSRLTASAQLVEAVQSAFGAFGCAWRLLDDLRDIPSDMARGVKSAVYVCLPEDLKRMWGPGKRGASGIEKQSRQTIQGALETKIVAPIVERLCRELDVAAAIADGIDIKGYAEELRTLAAPLRSPAGVR